MSRGYLNSLSFPAADVESSLQLLSELRQGIAKLVNDKVIVKTVSCTIRAAQLPLSPEYVTLPNAAKTHAGRFRDTILFFLNALDQRSPVHGALADEDQEEAKSSVVDESECSFDPHAAVTFMSCMLDGGVLLSLGSVDRWRKSTVDIKVLSATTQAERSTSLPNVHNATSAEFVSNERTVANSTHRFDNWDLLTGGARRSAQMDDWFAQCQTRPGLEQVIMRSLALARNQGWSANGDLIKKLGAKTSTSIFEVRAWYAGSNNVRMLFGRLVDGSIAVGYGGTKTSPDWYDYAIPQAERFISDC